MSIQIIVGPKLGDEKQFHQGFKSPWWNRQLMKMKAASLILFCQRPEAVTMHVPIRRIDLRLCQLHDNKGIMEHFITIIVAIGRAEFSLRSQRGR